MKKAVLLCFITLVASLSFQAIGQKSRLAPSDRSSLSDELIKSWDINAVGFDNYSSPLFASNDPLLLRRKSNVYRTKAKSYPTTRLKTPKAIPESGHPPYFYANGKMMNEVEYPKRWTKVKTPTMLRMASRNITLGKKKKKSKE
ncbi:MAG TPA: hypothetical protein DCS93_36825 [Microscillaceae bacterium]|nr:hypothetical protein [Microscillaceae bacterium]